MSKPFSSHCSDLIVRALSGSVYVACMLLAVYAGVLPLALLLSILAGLASYEFVNIARSSSAKPSALLAIIVSALFPLLIILGAPVLMMCSFAVVVAAMIWYLVDERVSLADIALTLCAPLYTGFLLMPLVLIRLYLPDFRGALVLGGLLVSVWVSDSFAYLIGSLIGKHKLAPKISPKKSWEGFIAGTIGCTAVWYALSLFSELHLRPSAAIVIGLSCAIMGLVGDLIESRMKRFAHIKDSGKFLPGHGGILDRIDSLLLVSTVAFVLLYLSGIF